MNFLSNFFRAKSTHQEPSQTPPTQDKAIAFVDFEYWFYSYRDSHHISPNVSKWAAEITGQYHVSDIMVFADLSYPRIQQEAQQLRAVTNTYTRQRSSARRSPHTSCLPGMGIFSLRRDFSR